MQTRQRCLFLNLTRTPMNSSIARIHVNGIEVGTLPATTYDEIYKSVHKDPRLYLAWVFEAVLATLRPLVKFYSALPSVVVGALLLCAAVWPEVFTAFITDLKAADPATITAGLRNVLGVFCTVFTVSFPVLAVFKPGLVEFESPFAKRLSRIIRGLLEVPTEGRLTVEIVDLALASPLPLKASE